MSDRFLDPPLGYVELHGKKIPVRTDRDCEAVDYVICKRRAPGEADLSFPTPGAKCSRCGHPVHRDNRGPVLPLSVCMQCAFAARGFVKAERVE